jgi:hypothetical protein
MKCLCGYEYDAMAKDDGENEPFVRISGSTFKRRSSRGYGHEQDVYLYACPKCDTIKMKDW